MALSRRYLARLYLFDLLHQADDDLGLVARINRALEVAGEPLRVSTDDLPVIRAAVEDQRRRLHERLYPTGRP